ncbi:nuclear transport factor 2 family protein [Spirosoma rigui]|uniref:nuclear transport factor 2 family protein n=1 Tax=Spirosoma rigui TaxID=564064 RepID=UPI0009B055BB|nr:nuclear transport factor 2 family protein [Spirosoma rigui]
MKLLITFVAGLLFSTATFAQQTADPTQDPTALGNAFFKAMLDEDATTLGKLLASDFSIISFDGHKVDGDMLVQGVGGGFVVIETGVVSNAQTRQYNSDSAVMTGNWKVKGNIQGQALESDATFSVVSAKQGGSWKVVNVQFTPGR